MTEKKTNRHTGDEQYATEVASENDKTLWPYTGLDK